MARFFKKKREEKKFKLLTKIREKHRMECKEKK
jgi:hypothetical protein